jgi:hypothetical protein
VSLVSYRVRVRERERNREREIERERERKRGGKVEGKKEEGGEAQKRHKPSQDFKHDVKAQARQPRPQPYRRVHTLGCIEAATVPAARPTLWLYVGKTPVHAQALLAATVPEQHGKRETQGQRPHCPRRLLQPPKHFDEVIP